MNEIELNLKKKIFFHGTQSKGDVIMISKEGFKSEYKDEEGRWYRDGNLGVGIYITCNWKTALWFGNILLSVSLKTGTKIVDTGKAADTKTINYLKKEFSNDILTSHNIRKVLPLNKKLRLNELIELTRYHYCKVWEKNWGKNKMGFSKWTTKRKRHNRCLESCVNLIKQYGFHGYGNPNDDNGIVIFSADRIVLNEVVAFIPEHDYSRMDGSGKLYDLSLGAIRSKWSVNLEELINPTI